MQSENRLFDDFVKMMNGAAGTLAGVGREAEASFKERAKEWIAGMDFVSREEFEAVKAMAAAARDERARNSRATRRAVDRSAASEETARDRDQTARKEEDAALERVR